MSESLKKAQAKYSQSDKGKDRAIAILLIGKLPD